MSGPITFDPIPNPMLPDLADGVDAFTDTASAVDGNFAKVRTRMASTPVRYTTAELHQGGTYNAGGTWDWFHLYGPVNFTLPDPCVGMLVMLHGHLSFKETIYSYGALGLAFGGTGIKNVPPIDATKLWVANKMMDTTRGYLFRAVDLNPGGAVSCSARAKWSGTSGTGASYVGNSWVTFLMFTGA